MVHNQRTDRQKIDVSVKNNILFWTPTYKGKFDAISVIG